MRDFDEAAEGALVSCRRGVDQDAALNRLPRRLRKQIDALLEGARGIAAIDGDFRHQGVRETMRHDVCGPLALAKAVRADRLAPAALGADPGVNTRLKLPGSLRDCGSAQPTGEGVRREFQENAFAELLDGREPMWAFGERGPPNREANIFEVFRRQRCRLEAREAVEAGDLAEPMHGDEALDASQDLVAAGIPDVAIKRLRVQMRTSADAA